MCANIGSVLAQGTLRKPVVTLAKLCRSQPGSWGPAQHEREPPVLRTFALAVPASVNFSLP